MKTKRVSAQHIERHLAATHVCTVGDIERLAGINTCSHAERVALWKPWAHLHVQSGSAGWDAVRSECHRRAARMVNAGHMCLVGAA